MFYSNTMTSFIWAMQGDCIPEWARNLIHMVKLISLYACFCVVRGTSATSYSVTKKSYIYTNQGGSISIDYKCIAYEFGSVSVTGR